MRNVSVYDCAMNYGTSVHYIEKTYAKTTNCDDEAERTNEGARILEGDREERERDG